MASSVVARRILLTSFAPWKGHQHVNSSDQLLEEITQIPRLAKSLYFFRYLPVNLPVARDIVTAKIQQIQPDLLVCCGMAESRFQLNVEAQAVVNNVVLATELDLKQLTVGLNHTVISYDAGRFVCNSLYHAMLNYLKSSPGRNGLFIHVPLLTPENRELIVVDFCQLLERLLTTNAGI
jgi:pyroglutamyl-peptidase